MTPLAMGLAIRHFRHSLPLPVHRSAPHIYLNKSALDTRLFLDIYAEETETKRK
jgi:hypothetical protein